jgi:hypothetical protein
VNATLTRKTDVSGDSIVAILRDCRIPAQEWEEWLALTLYGVRPSFAPSIRRGNRGRAFSLILTALSNAYFAEKGIRFPPPGWKPSKRKLASVA